MKNLKKILVWDIDGVLVYVGESYRQTIIETVQYYFSECVGLRLDKPLMRWEDTQSFKLAGGFNDDWELTYAAVLCYLTRLLSEVDASGMDTTSSKPHDLDAILQRLHGLGLACRRESLDLDLDPITERIREHGGGLNAALKALSQMYGEDLGNAKKFWFPDLIKRVFEETYLGEELFQRKYGENRRFISGKGLISREKPLIGLETLRELLEKYYFGVVTGRERFEAEYSLQDHFNGIFKFDQMVTREDTHEKKPSPEPLLKCRKKICVKYALPKDIEATYIGDSLDDLRAAGNAGFQFIAFLGGIKNKSERNVMRKEFQDMNCSLIIEDARGLLGIT